jgi:hypothetical protein
MRQANAKLKEREELIGLLKQDASNTFMITD